MYGELVSYADRQELNAAIARLVEWEPIVSALTSPKGDG